MSNQKIAKLTTEVLKPATKRMQQMGLSAEDVTRETGYALQIVNGSERLLKCSKESILSSIIFAASTGLTLNPAVQHACLVPRWTRGQGTVCVFEPMYRGLMFLAVEEGAATKFNIQAVHEKDTFKASPDNDKQPVVHEFSSFDRGSIVGFYSVATMLDGTKTAEFMSVDEINKVRDTSDGYKALKAGKVKSHPWDSNYSEMAKKTIVKRHVKRLPSGKADSKLYTAIDLDNLDYTVETVHVPEVVPALPTLTKDHKDWDGAVKSVARGVERDQAEKVFTITDEVWEALKEDAQKLELAQ